MIIYRPLTLRVPQFLEALLDLEALGYSLQVNPTLSLHVLATFTEYVVSLHKHITLI